MSEEQAKHLCYLSAHDLRIGNWVYDGEFTKFPMQVVVIGEDWVYLDFPCNEGDVWEECPKELQPIPLTSEFFEKNGFVKERFYCKVFYFKKINGMILKAYEHSIGWEIHMKHEESINAFSKGIDYVHELQNAYYVSTGEELEIEL